MSTADINPYAPPRVLDPPVKVDPGVGVWLDGELLVIHRAAVLPPVCVKSGGPATMWIDLPIDLTLLSMLAQGRLTVRVPLSERGDWVRRYGLRIWLGITGIAMAALIPLYFLNPLVFEVLALIDILIGLIALLSALKYHQLLACCRAQRDYLWFAGADRRFLAQLPPWPGGA